MNYYTVKNGRKAFVLIFVKTWGFVIFFTSKTLIFYK